MTSFTKSQDDASDSDFEELGPLLNTLRPNESIWVEKPKSRQGDTTSWHAFSQRGADQRSAEIAQLQASLRKRGNSILFHSHAVANDGERFPLFLPPDHPKQPRKLSGPLAGLPRTKIDSSDSDDPPNDLSPPPVPLHTTHAQLLAGLRAKPKSTPVVPSTPYKQSPHRALWFADRSNDDPNQDGGKATDFAILRYPGGFPPRAISPLPFEQQSLGLVEYPAPLEFPQRTVSPLSSSEQQYLSTFVDEPALLSLANVSSASLERDQQQHVEWNWCLKEAYEQEYAAFSVHSHYA